MLNKSNNNSFESSNSELSDKKNDYDDNDSFIAKESADDDDVK